MRYLFSLLVFFAAFHVGWAQQIPPGQRVDIELVGEWHETIDVNFLVAGAGTDLSASLESDPDAVNVSVSPHAPGRPWCLFVRASNVSTWPDNVRLDVRWTGSSDYTLLDPIAGVARNVYLELSELDQEFLDGQRSVDVDLQYRVRGLSVALSPQDIAYLHSTITYTASIC